jgi:hypothetical protein
VRDDRWKYIRYRDGAEEIDGGPNDSLASPIEKAAMSYERKPHVSLL